MSCEMTQIGPLSVCVLSADTVLQVIAKYHSREPESNAIHYGAAICVLRRVSAAYLTVVVLRQEQVRR